ncbi:MAG: hypothetical protein ACE5J2_08780, partial [Nitrososphaerales archaeon]
MSSKIMLGIGLGVILLIGIFSLNYTEQQTATGNSHVSVLPISQLVSFNSTSVSNDVNIPQEDGICGNFKVEVRVNKHVLYEDDKLIIQGNAPLGAKLEGRLIPLDGVTPGKMVSVPLKGSHFEYPLYQFGPEDKEVGYAAVITALKETRDGDTCLLGDFELTEYKGARIDADNAVQNTADTLTITDAVVATVDRAKNIADTLTITDAVVATVDRAK